VTVKKTRFLMPLSGIKVSRCTDNLLVHYVIRNVCALAWCDSVACSLLYRCSSEF
jgi:hypothetical protein